VPNIRGFRQLRVYQMAFTVAMEAFHLSKRFPAEERYALTSQVRRCTRSVCSSLAECWRKRAYPKHFISKLTDAESEAEEGRVWLQFAYECGYIELAEARKLDATLNSVIAQLVAMKTDPQSWTIH
jgi:four helix bundle protein